MNNPVRYSDPSGHFSRDEIISFFGVDTWNQVLVIFDNGDLKDRWGWLMILQRAELGDKISIRSGDKTITGVFDIDQNDNLIVAVDKHNYYVDQKKIALLGDAFTLTKEVDLYDLLCSPFHCILEYYEFETDAIRPPLPYEYVRPSTDSDFEDTFDPPMNTDSLPNGGGGGVSGPLDMLLFD